MSNGEESSDGPDGRRPDKILDFRRGRQDARLVLQTHYGDREQFARLIGARAAFLHKEGVAALAIRREETELYDLFSLSPESASQLLEDLIWVVKRLEGEE